MKRMICVLLAMAILCTLSACGDTPLQEEWEEAEMPESVEQMGAEEYREDEGTQEKEEEEMNADEEAEESTAVEQEEEAVTETGENEIRPDFKEAMDSYEALMNEYADFMEAYAQSDNVAGMMVEYAEYMGKYAEAVEKLNAIDTEELSVAELAYYTEVTARVLERLAEVDS